MNIVDIILGIILILAFVRGMKKGLFVTLASLIGLVLGVIGAIYFSEYAGKYINQWFDLNEFTGKITAMIVTFIGIVILINWAGKFLTKIADFAFLGIFNKLLGGVFNMLMTAFIISVGFMFFNQWNITSFLISKDKTENSILYQPITALAPRVLPNLINKADKIKIPNNIIKKLKKPTNDNDPINNK